MRSRPLGPGLGGLYYSPLLRDSNANRSATASAPQTVARPPVNRLAAIWQAIADASRRAGQRLVESRMAEARQHLNVELRRYHLDAASRGRAAPVRYY